MKSPQAELSNDSTPAFDTHTFNSVNVMSGSQLPHPATPNGSPGLPGVELKVAQGNTTKEQVEDVVKGRKSRYTVNIILRWPRHCWEVADLRLDSLHQGISSRDMLLLVSAFQVSHGRFSLLPRCIRNRGG